MGPCVAGPESSASAAPETRHIAAAMTKRLFIPELSLRYAEFGAARFVALGLLSPGSWFGGWQKHEKPVSQQDRRPYQSDSTAHFGSQKPERQEAADQSGGGGACHPSEAALDEVAHRGAVAPQQGRDQEEARAPRQQARPDEHREVEP